jgi:OOP family OmpA-OmpF porin
MERRVLFFLFDNLIQGKTIMKKVLIASLLSSLFVAPAFAAVPGPYVALDVQNWSATNTGALGNPGVGLRIGGGYRFTENWGVEANYAQSGKSTSVAGADYKFTALQLAATGTYPINNQFDVYAKLGFSANKFDVTPSVASNSKTSFLYGVGGQYNINQQWGVRLEYENLGDTTNFAGGNQVSASTISIGGVYSF